MTSLIYSISRISCYSWARFRFSTASMTEGLRWLLNITKNNRENFENAFALKMGGAGPRARASARRLHPHFLGKKGISSGARFSSVKQQKLHAFPNWSCILHRNICNKSYEWWHMQHERGHRRIHLSRTTPSIPWIHYFCSDSISKKSDSLLFEFIQLRPPKKWNSGIVFELI